MSWNGSGVFSLIYSWTQDAANGVDISATRMDAQEADLATNGFGNCLTRDGQGSASANLPMNTNRHTGVGNGAALDDYLALGQLKTGAIVYAGTAGGTVDALTGATTPANLALTNGMQVLLKAAGANTLTNPTFVLDSIGSPLNITKTGGQLLAAGDIFGAGHMLNLVYSSTGTRWELQNPAGSLGASTGTGSLVRATSPAITTPTISSPTISGTIAGTMTSSVGVTLLGSPPSLSGNGQAVLGTTATGGLVIAGEGSINDFTLENRSGTTVATVATNTTVVNFVSTPTIGGTAIPTTAGTRATSTDQSISNAGTFTFTHSLGRLPDSIRYYLVCQTNDNGYTAGQIIDIGPPTPGTGPDSGFAAVVTTTTIVVTFADSNNMLLYISGSNQKPVSLTSANWKMRVVAAIVA